MVHATLVVEDILQEAAVHRVLTSEGIPVSIYRTIGLQGAGFIDTNVARLVRASAHGRYIVIRDLDRHHCPPELLRQMFGGSPPEGLLFVVPRNTLSHWLGTRGNAPFGTGSLRRERRRLATSTTPSCLISFTTTGGSTAHGGGHRVFSALSIGCRSWEPGSSSPNFGSDCFHATL